MDVIEQAAERGFTLEEKPLQDRWVWAWRRYNPTAVNRHWAIPGRIGRMLVSVKGGKAVNPAMVNEIHGTVQREQAEMGILITLTEPTRGMRDTAAKSGTYTSTLTGQDYLRIQIISVAELMAGKRPKMPTAILPYLKAKPRDPDQLTLGGA